VIGFEVAGGNAIRHRWIMMFDPGPSRPNPLSPNLMSPAERRAELCSLLALGLIRLRLRDSGKVSDDTGESCLHFPPRQSGTAGATHRRTA